jgi:hypothetical protein
VKKTQAQVKSEKFFFLLPSSFFLLPSSLIAGAKATASAIRALKSHPLDVKAIQDYYIS